MTRTLPLLVMSTLLTACSNLAPVAFAPPSSGTEPSRQILVTTPQASGYSLAVVGDPGSFYLRRRGYAPIPSVDRRLDEIAEDYGIRRLRGWYISSLGAYCEVYELDSGQDADAMIARIGADPRVELVQSMNLFETEALAYDDPYAPMQPALAALAIVDAHESATGEGVTIAIVDSSVDRRHRELRGRIRTERDLVHVDSRRGPEVHGTAVAGVIGSRANNGEGIVGIAPDSTLLPLRACWTVDAATGRARCSSFSLAQALESAIALDADIVNLSLAGPPDALLTELIDAAISRGIIVVAAQSVGDATNSSFPSSHSGVIAASSSHERPASAPQNVLRAPGDEVMSTAPNNSYAFFSGNSMSAAYVSGVSALIKQHKPDIRAAELIELLGDTGKDDLINACRALARIDGSGRCTESDN